MIIRIIVRTDSAAMAANVGGSVLTEHRTFDIELPPVVAAYLNANLGDYNQRQIVGTELREGGAS